MGPPAKRRKVTNARVEPQKILKPRDNTQNASHENEDNDVGGFNMAEASSSFGRSAQRASNDLEADYFARKREQQQKKKGKENQRLPIKTAEGTVEAAPAYPSSSESEGEGGDEDEWGGLDSDAGAKDGTPPTSASDSENPSAAPKQPRKLSKREILDAQEQLAKLAGQITEDPEDNLNLLKTLAEFTQRGENTTVRNLALATSTTVFKDIVPSYRIRAVTGAEQKSNKVSKDVRSLRDFEQGLLKAYTNFVNTLTDLCTSKKGIGKDQEGGDPLNHPTTKRAALGCVAFLVRELSHFNHRDELANILVSKITRRKRPTADDEADASLAREALESLFESDEDGYASLAVIGHVQKLIRDREHACHPDALAIFQHLRLLTEFAHTASSTTVFKSSPDPNNTEPKQKKKDRQFINKRQRKQLKERKAIEKEFKEADAQVTAEDRETQQGEMLKRVFTTYLRVLKKKTPHLMPTTLEGLARYAHLINADFFGDVLECLKDLIREAEAVLDPTDDFDNLTQPPEDEDTPTEPSTPQDISQATHETLLCLLTAFRLSSSQSRAANATLSNSLDLDLSFFATRLWRCLLPFSLSPTLYPSPSETSSVVNTLRTHTPLLTNTLLAIISPSNPRTLPASVLASFLKKTLTASLSTPSQTSTALLSALTTATKQSPNKRKIASLWDSEDRKGDGVCDVQASEVGAANVWAGNVWEGELLGLHFDPKVRDGWKGLEGVVKSAIGGAGR